MSKSRLALMAAMMGAEPTPPAPRLPDGYTEVEYIGNSNNSLIRIEFYSNPRYSVHLKFGQDAVNKGFVCATNTNYTPTFYSYYDTNYNSFYVYLTRNGTSLTSKKIYTPLDTDIHTVDYVCNGTSETYYHNGVQVSSNGYDMTNANDDTLPLALFARNKGASSSDYFYKGRIYEFWIKDGDTKLVDLVPCTRDSDSKPGFYDIVREEFYSGGANIYAGSAI